MRNDLTDWEDLLEDQIKSNGNALHTHHLASMKTITTTLLNFVGSTAEELSPLSWEQDNALEAAGEVGDLSISTLKSSRAAVQKKIENAASESKACLLNY